MFPFMDFNGMDFIFAAIGISIAVRAISAAGFGRNRLPPEQAQPVQLEDPRVPHLQAEVEALRTQVERLAATETFYAQLNAPRAAAVPVGAGTVAEDRVPVG
ncbi:MAG TPA: hypothetical protein VEX86_21475 [Longimicrobium sp.]|nr:hypothetical protein [Longimicrobium sp.]